MASITVKNMLLFKRIKQWYIRRYSHCECYFRNAYFLIKGKTYWKPRRTRYRLYSVETCKRCGRKYKRKIGANLTETHLNFKMHEYGG